MIAVISSCILCLWCHFSVALSTICLQQFSVSWDLWKCVTVSSISINETWSLMPSEHTSIALSVCLSLGIILTVGVAITPHVFARASPKLRDIASPGWRVALFQTLMGPIFLPVASDTNWSRTPLLLRILSFSSSILGLWSKDNYSALKSLEDFLESLLADFLDAGRSLNIIAGESPTFPMIR